MKITEPNIPDERIKTANTWTSQSFFLSCNSSSPTRRLQKRTHVKKLHEIVKLQKAIETDKIICMD
jgi:hypothetical protein